MANAKKPANRKSAESKPVHHYRGLGHTISLFLTMTAAFFLGLVILSLILLRGQ